MGNWSAAIEGKLNPVSGTVHPPGAFKSGDDRQRAGVRALRSRQADLRELKAVSRNEALAAIAKQLLMTNAELRALAVDPETNGVNALVAAVLSKAIQHGDVTRAQFLLSYVIGKPSTYDPTPEDTTKEQRAALASIPSEVLLAALRSSASITPSAPDPNHIYEPKSE